MSAYESVEDGLLPLESLNVVMVGGGPTGVELAGAVKELQHEIHREFEHIAPKATVTLLEAGPQLLPTFHPDSSKYTLKTLTKMGVHVQVDAAVVEMRSWLRFQGSLAWLTWLALDLAYLPGGRNRTSIFADWIWNYLVWTPRQTIIY